MRFIQMVMGQSADAIDFFYTLIEHFVFWKSPDKTLILVKTLFRFSLLSAIGLYFFAIRYMLVCILWIISLSNSQFFLTMGLLLS
mmetsp:Transcript_35595/g.34625  ORF Transcript_35595/g.34625 Transcript_35595/m.34625 type:complete len:85 (-) Transcript_35595:195-449(-)